MMDDPFDRIVVPLASVEDATRTARAIATRFDAATVTAVTVIENADGVPNQASVERGEEDAEDVIDAFDAEPDRPLLAIPGENA